MKFDSSLSSRVICFDAEMVDEQRLIELSIYNIEAKEIYHSYFNPGRVRRWREDIHHISRDMVKDAPRFAAQRPKVQNIIDGADYMVGCAISNDTGSLALEGVRNLDSKRVVEIQEWYWLLYDYEAGESLYRTRSLLAIADAVGVDFDESTAHGASADTRATLLCFLRLAEIFADKYGMDADAGLEEVVEEFGRRFAAARLDFLERDAAGVVQIIRRDDCYTLKFNHKIEKPHAKMVAMIEVADRFIAEYELRKLFARRQDSNFPDGYRLRQVDIDRFKLYKNSFDEQRSAFCRSFTNGRLNRINSPFNIRF